MLKLKQFTDTMANVLDLVGGVGTSNDPAKRIRFSTTVTNFSESEVLSTYTGSGLLQKVVEFLPNKARQATFVELSPAIESAFNELRILELFKQSSISARIFKECYLFIEVEDGKELDEPLDKIPNKINKITLIECDQLTFKANTLQERTSYKLKTEEGDVNIHPTRILVFFGKYFTPKVRASTGGYHGSILNGILPTYGVYSHSLNIASSLLARLVTFVFKMNNLKEMVAEGRESEIVARLKLHQKGIGSVGGLIIDADSEAIEWLTFSISGISELIHTFKDSFTSETELSHDILWNEGSHNTTSELELENTNEKINEFIETCWEENFNQLAEIITGTPTNVKLEYQKGKQIDSKPDKTDSNPIETNLI